MKITVNGVVHPLKEEYLNLTLIDYLREVLDLTGTKNGCGIGVCGACTVLVDMKVVRACKKQVKDFIDANVLTIEGMASPDGTLHPLQQSFIDAGAIQCGFCTPGMVLTAHAFLSANPNPTRAEIRKAINGNLCRCTGYQQIIDAIEAYASSVKN
ncbi:MAG TPA: (2Fe-2S)-binding protein [Candidatus Cloacimonadota bacterium]|nr:(2Fe-2S)-binding protein [Candidatus Cloacimonadota bacterium]HPT72226.1 (2Fe-2S)-binding protein [Candidatus Cloacimonadota bacterium]